MNFYLSAVDDQVKHTDDQPSIGVILCKGRNSIVVEYALRDTSKPMGVAEYRLTPAPSLPPKLRRELPTMDELASEFSLLSLVGLRIEIERTLLDVMDRRGIPVPAHPTLASMTQALKKKKLMPNNEEFRNAIQVMNSAVHGYEVDPAAAQEAFRAGKKLLAEVRKLIHDK